VRPERGLELEQLRVQTDRLPQQVQRELVPERQVPQQEQTDRLQRQVLLGRVPEQEPLELVRERRASRERTNRQRDQPWAFQRWWVRSFLDQPSERPEQVQPGQTDQPQQVQPGLVQPALERQERMDRLQPELVPVLEQASARVLGPVQQEQMGLLPQELVLEQEQALEPARELVLVPGRQEQTDQLRQEPGPGPARGLEPVLVQQEQTDQLPLAELASVSAELASEPDRPVLARMDRLPLASLVSAEPASGPDRLA
jgi:hypothetical protein